MSRCVAAALLAVLLLVSPLIANASAPKAQACEDDASPALRGSRCVTVDVPLRHVDSSGEHLSLFLRRIPASVDEAKRGEVWLLSGGPGESGASLYPLIQTYQRAFPRFDLVIPDHKTPNILPRMQILQGTFDPNTAYAGAEEHAATLGRSGAVMLHTVERGAHLLALVPPRCFITAVGNFIDGAVVSERCTEPPSK